MIGLIILGVVVWAVLWVFGFGFRAIFRSAKVLVSMVIIPGIFFFIMKVGVIGMIILLLVLGSIASKLIDRIKRDGR